MAIKIDKDAATRLFTRAFDESECFDDGFSVIIRSIIEKSYIAYKYILVSALLAKATDDKIDVFSLQTKDTSDGAYNARNVCSDIIFPIEQMLSPYGLGGSRDPLVGNPGRHPRLDSEMKTRSKKKLDELITAVSMIDSQETARKYLRCVAAVMKEQSAARSESLNPHSLNITSSGDNSHSQQILDLIDKLTKRSCFGETCPIIVSAIESMCFPELTITPHTVNESGQSNNEVGDIDVKDSNKNLVSAMEIKDKPFESEDVIHAITSFHEAGLAHSFFIYGPFGEEFDFEYVSQAAARFGRAGTFCAIISLRNYVQMRLYDNVGNVNIKEFVARLLKFAEVINARQETIMWLRRTISANHS